LILGAVSLLPASAKTLGLAFLRLDLWPTLFEGHNQASLRQLVDWMVQSSLQARDICFAQLCQGVIHLDPIRRLTLILPFLFSCRLSELVPDYFQYGNPPAIAAPTDAVDDLFRWPIPTRLSHLTGKRNIATANVFGMMTAIQSSPSLIITSRYGDDRLALAIALLGAAHIVAETEPDSLLGNSGALGGPPQNPSTGPVNPRDLWLQRIAIGAYAWFVEQMPQLIFPQKLEEVIQQTAELSYNEPSAPVTV
jgi:hypothetical protein